ncbi:MAG: putative membrane protein, partial [Planctomycetota bacterium]
DEAFRANCLLLSAEPEFVQEFTQVSGMSSIRSFPSEFAELDKYDVLIFGDVDPSRLATTPAKVKEALENIQRFVDNGGGLAVICGEGWTPRAYADSPLDQILPVDITTDGDVGGPMSTYVDEWKPKLSAIGRTHPIMQLRKDPEENRSLWEDRNKGLMELRWWYPIRKASPAAQVLAYHPNERNRFGNFPLFVTGTYGDGPVFFSAVDETWRWFYMKGAYDFNRFWGNTIRYLARAHLYRGSKRFKLVSNASEYRQGETVHLTAFTKDKNFKASRNNTQRVMLVPPTGKARMVEFPRKNDGEYHWSFKPAKDGHFEAWIVGEEGLTGSRYAPISFDVRFIDPERQQAGVDIATMKEIARASGGAFFSLEDAAGVLERLQSDTTRHSSITTSPLRSKPWLPLILIILVTTEWLLRKRSNMA